MAASPIYQAGYARTRHNVVQLPYEIGRWEIAPPEEEDAAPTIATRIASLIHVQTTGYFPIHVRVTECFSAILSCL